MNELITFCKHHMSDKTSDLTNYIEMFIIEPCSIETNINQFRKNDIHPEMFHSMMSKFKNNNTESKLFSKKYTKLYHQDLVLTKQYSDLEENVFTVDIVNHRIFDLEHFNCLVICYKKNILPVYMFPSTNEINNIIDFHRLSAKMNNLLYINFEIAESVQQSDNKQDLDLFNHFIYFNFNSNKHQDVNHTCELLKNVINSLLL